MRGISVLGSTGSIGTQTLDVIRRNNDIKVVALAAGTRVKELANQVREFRPELVCIGSEKLAAELKVLLADIDVKIVYGDGNKNWENVWDGKQPWDREIEEKSIPENAVLIDRPDDIIKTSIPYMIIPCIV